MACTAIGHVRRADAHAAALPAQERDRAARGIEPEQRSAREQHGIDAGYRHLRVQQGGVATTGRAAAGDAGGDVGGVEDDRRDAGGDARVLGIADAHAGDIGDEIERAQAMVSACELVLPTKLAPRAFAVNGPTGGIPRTVGTRARSRAGSRPPLKQSSILKFHA